MPDGMEVKPLRGWRTWQGFVGGVNQSMMEATMRGLALPRPELVRLQQLMDQRSTVAGGQELSQEPFYASSLAAAGYRDVGLDSGYYLSGKGYKGTCHTQDGHMVINKALFPDFRGMTDTAHSLNLTASWYLNADGCNGTKEWAVGETYDTDAADVLRYGFDGVKFDTEMGGPNNNITKWAIALADARRHSGTRDGIVIENCQDKNPTYILDQPSDCPYNHYRTGPDAAPHFYGAMWRIFHYTLPYLRVTEPVPASRPNCWAYADQLAIGTPVPGTSFWDQARSRGCANMTLEEERTLFANWAIVSSPLVLGFDVRNKTTVAHYWPIVTNARALAINDAWVGNPGLLLKQSSTSTYHPMGVGATCEGKMVNASLPGWLIYAKPLPEGAVAALVINMNEYDLIPSQVPTVSLSELHSVVSAATAGAQIKATAYDASDVWTGAALGVVDAAHPYAPPGLAAHHSSFIIFSSRKAPQ